MMFVGKEMIVNLKWDVEVVYFLGGYLCFCLIE